jgi:hypothetical protein
MALLVLVSACKREQKAPLVRAEPSAPPVTEVPTTAPPAPAPPSGSAALAAPSSAAPATASASAPPAAKPAPPPGGCLSSADCKLCCGCRPRSEGCPPALCRGDSGGDCACVTGSCVWRGPVRSGDIGSVRAGDNALGY